MSEYNGHPSYDHWNVALWFGNDEGLYGIARGSSDWETLSSNLGHLGIHDTPDGVRLSAQLIRYAWESVQDE